MSGAERQARLAARRRADGSERACFWASARDLEALRRAYPGPRQGIDWTAVVGAALGAAAGVARPARPEVYTHEHLKRDAPDIADLVERWREEVSRSLAAAGCPPLPPDD